MRRRMARKPVPGPCCHYGPAPFRAASGPLPTPSQGRSLVQPSAFALFKGERHPKNGTALSVRKASLGRDRWQGTGLNFARTLPA